MKKFHNTIKIFLLILSFCILVPSMSLASNDENFLNDKYRLRDISFNEIPKGIIPLEVDNEKELEKIISNLKDIELNITLPNFNNNLVSTRAVGSKEVYINANIGSGLTIRLDADFSYYAQGSFGAIEKINNVRLSLLGSTLMHDLTDKQTWSSINNGIASINGKADLNTYLIIKTGTFKLLTRPVTIRFNYGLRELYHNVYVKVGDTIIRK